MLANHYELTGAGVTGVVDLSGITGSPVFSLEVDGLSVTDGTVEAGELGVVLTAVLDAAPDSHTTRLRLVLPEVNLAEGSVLVAGLAVVVKTRSSIGGPGLVDGALQSYALRPVAGTASFVESLTQSNR